MSLAGIDYKWFSFINDLVLKYPIIDDVMIFLTKYGKNALIIFVFILGLANWRNYRMIAFQALVAYSLAFLTNRILERLIPRERPFVTHDVTQLIEKAATPSFPSDHAALTTAITFILCFSSLRFRYLWVILAIGVSFSRVWVGVHYPFDVIAGFIIGLTMAIITHFVLFKHTPLAKLAKTSFFHKQENGPQQ